MALDFTENCQDLLGTKKSNILPNIYEEIFFKLAHYFFSFCQCNPISDIHLKHTDHCFQFFVNKIWSITNITRMPLQFHVTDFQLDCIQLKSVAGLSLVSNFDWKSDQAGAVSIFCHIFVRKQQRECKWKNLCCKMLERM